MSLQIGKIDGIPIRLHFTLLLAVLLISWSLATGFMPAYLPGLSLAAYWTMGAIGAFVLFFSVLVHELAHSKLAMRYGIKIRRIVLFLFGGVSDISEELTDYRKEAKMALAGPLTSFAIAGCFGLALFVFGIAGYESVSPWGKMLQGVLFYGAVINAMLGAFNLIPAFPSDGGRILRAALVRQKKDYVKATLAASKVGVAISCGFIALGLLAMLGGSFLDGIWILLIGWFLMSGAQSYASQTQLSSTLSSMRLGEIMNTNVIAVKESTTVDELLVRYFQTFLKSAFPVIDEAGRLLGMVTLRRAMDVAEYNRPSTTAGDIMLPREDLVIAGPEVNAEVALAQMTKSKVGKILVVNQAGILVGLVSKTDILGVEMERQEIAQAVKR